MRTKTHQTHLTLIFNRLLEVVDRAKLHHAECSGSWVVYTKFFALSRNGKESENPVLWPWRLTNDLEIFQISSGGQGTFHRAKFTSYNGHRGKKTPTKTVLSVATADSNYDKNSSSTDTSRRSLQMLCVKVEMMCMCGWRRKGSRYRLKMGSATSAERQGDKQSPTPAAGNLTVNNTTGKTQGMFVSLSLWQYVWNVGCIQWTFKKWSHPLPVRRSVLLGSIPNSKLSYFSNPTLHRHLAPLRTDFTDTRTALRLFFCFSFFF